MVEFWWVLRTVLGGYDDHAWCSGGMVEVRLGG